MQFYYKRETNDGLISGILDVIDLDSFAEQLEEFLEDSSNGEVVIFRVDKEGTFDPDTIEWDEEAG